MMQFAWPNQIKCNCGGKRELFLREEHYLSEETNQGGNYSREETINY